MKILVSYGYGAGWSSWSHGETARKMLTYQPIIDFIEGGGDVKELTGDWEFDKSSKEETFKGHPLLVQLAEELNNEYTCFLGADDLQVVEASGSFRVTEYDGAENVEYRDSLEWYNG